MFDARSLDPALVTQSAVYLTKPERSALTMEQVHALLLAWNS
jgi:hypothetical protein